jgi:hypothetical protein
MGGFANNAPIVTDGLVFYVDAGNSKSYPGSGTTWTDLIGGNNGSLTNMDATNHSSTNGGIFTFDGGDEYVDYGDVINIGTNDFTISVWVRLSSTISDSYAVIAGKSYAGAGNRYSFLVDTTSKINAFIADTNSGILSTGTTALSTNTWYMLTVVFDRDGNVSMYINDTIDTVASNADISSKSASNITDSSISFRIGAYADSDKTSPRFEFPGNIATTLVYFKALSSAEILQNYNALKNRFV